MPSSFELRQSRATHSLSCLSHLNQNRSDSGTGHLSGSKIIIHTVCTSCCPAEFLLYILQQYLSSIPSRLDQPCQSTPPAYCWELFEFSGTAWISKFSSFRQSFSRSPKANIVPPSIATASATSTVLPSRETIAQYISGFSIQHTAI